MTTVKTKVAPLAAWTCGMFRDIREIQMKSPSLQNYSIAGANKALLIEHQRGYLSDLMALAQKADQYFRNPTADENINVPADFIDGIQTLDDEINRDMMLGLPEDTTDVREVINFDWMTDEQLTKLTGILTFCELHKCSSLVVALQSLTIKLVWLFAELVVQFATPADEKTGQFEKHEPFRFEPYFKDVLERFGCLVTNGDVLAKERNTFFFVKHENQVVFNDTELAQQRADELARQAEQRKEKALRDRQELSMTYGKEIVEALEKHNTRQANLGPGNARFVIPDQSYSVLCGPVTEDECQLVDDLSVFLRSYAAYAYPDKEYNGDRPAMFQDALAHLNTSVIIKGEMVIAQLINMVTPKVVIHSLKLLGNNLEAMVMSTKDILTDENEQYVYDFRLGTPIQIRKAK